MDSSPLDAVPEAAKEIPVEKASRSVGLSSGVIFLITTAIQAIGLIATIYLSKGPGSDVTGRAALGLVQFYLFVSSSINNVGDLRIGSAFTFFVSRGKNPSEATGTYLVLRLGMVFVGAAILWFVSPFIRITASSGGGTVAIAANGTELLALGIFLLLPLLWSVSTVYTQLTVAIGRSIHSQVPQLLESIIRSALLITVALSLPFPITTSGQVTYAVLLLTLAYVPGAIASMLYSLPLVLRHYSRFSRAETGVLFRFAWPLMGSLMLVWIASNAIGLYVVDLGGANQYAFFNAANGFRILALSVPAAVTVPLFPSLTSLHARGEIRVLRTQTYEALRFTAMALVPAALCLVLLRTDFLNTLMTGQYATAASVPLAILAVSAVPLGLSQVISTALNSVRLQRLEFYLTGAQVLVMFGLALVVGPPVDLLSRFGVNVLMAASLALLGSSVAAFAVNTYFMERHLRVRIALRPILTITAASAAAFLAISRFNLLTSQYRWYDLTVAVVLGFTVYALVLAALGELSKSDVRRVGGMVGLPGSVTGPLSRLCWRAESVFFEPSDPIPGEEPPAPGA